MSYIIPEMPRSVATQRQRERLLAQEAKYEKGVKGREDEEDLLCVLRDAGLGGSRGTGARGSWARRFSKLSDGHDANVDLSLPRHHHHHNNKPAADGAAVWEVTWVVLWSVVGYWEVEVMAEGGCARDDDRIIEVLDGWNWWPLLIKRKRIADWLLCIGLWIDQKYRYVGKE